MNRGSFNDRKVPTSLADNLGSGGGQCAEAADICLEEALLPPVNEFRRFVRVFFRRKIVLAGFIIVVLTLLAAILANVISPYDPYEQDLYNVLAKPGAAHLLGTDSLGRDTLSRIIHGSRISLTIGVLTVVFSAAVGTVIGLVAGYAGTAVQTVIMRLTDAIWPFLPGIGVCNKHPGTRRARHCRRRRRNADTGIYQARLRPGLSVNRTTMSWLSVLWVRRAHYFQAYSAQLPVPIVSDDHDDGHRRIDRSVFKLYRLGVRRRQPLGEHVLRRLSVPVGTSAAR